MRIALISDIHGNDYAFEAVLSEIARIGVDEMLFLGDVATLGPAPVTSLQRLRDLNCACIMGNHDEFLIDPALIHTYTTAKSIIDAVDWCREQLSEDDIAFLRTFDPNLEGDEAGSTVLYFHGSPKSHMDNILATTPPDEVEELLHGQSAGLLACGHTHIQMLRQHRGRLIINPGSIGLPFKEFVGGAVPSLLDHAEFGILTLDRGNVDVTFHRVELDRKTLRSAAAACDFPMRDYLVNEYS